MKNERVEKILYDFFKKSKEIRAILVSGKTGIEEINIYSKNQKVEKAADILINDKAASIGLETGDVNEYIDLAKKFSGLGLHATLWLSNKKPNQSQIDRVSFDSHSPKIELSKY